MRLIFKMIFLFLIATSQVFGEFPHLMLNFDINKTLIASDRSGGQSIHDVLNQLLSCHYQFRWNSSLQEPISYDTYIREILLPGPEYDLELKKKRRAYLNHFIDDLCEKHHPLYPEALITYHRALEKLQSAQGIVFPSFYHLLKKLDREAIPYTLILRSFGAEVFEIANEINANYQNKFLHMGIFNKGILLVDNEIKKSHPFEIYETLCSLTHIAIRDDWEYWIKGEMRSQFGKPFILDLSDHDVLGIFFDDHIELKDNEENIIAPIDAKTGKPVTITELASQNQIVRVDTLEAILNDDYFVECIQEALSKRNVSFQVIKSSL